MTGQNIRGEHSASPDNAEGGKTSLGKGARVEFKTYFSGVEAGTTGVVRRIDDYRVSVEVGDRRVSIPPKLVEDVLRRLQTIEDAQPIVMKLRCPACQAWHVDAPGCVPGPHSTHRCRVCDHEWTPREFPTHGTGDPVYSDDLIERLIRKTLTTVAPDEQLEVQAQDIEMFRTFLGFVESETHVRMRARIEGLRDATRIIDAVTKHSGAEKPTLLRDAARAFNEAIERNRHGKPAILRAGESGDVPEQSLDGGDSV